MVVPEDRKDDAPGPDFVFKIVRCELTDETCRREKPRAAARRYCERHDVESINMTTRLFEDLEQDYEDEFRAEFESFDCEEV